MTQTQQLVCLAPRPQTMLAMQPKMLGEPGRGQVLVRVLATSVNPIDVKRSMGYGQRLLTLKGASRFPLVLGNDLAGVVQSVGPGTSGYQPGDQVYGLVPTGRQGGSHASHVLAEVAYLRGWPAQGLAHGHAHGHAPALAALPYTFTTLWWALQSVGLNEANAKDKRVLVHGASGGLGQLALQLLQRWGARATAVCSTPHVQTCLALGAHEVLDRRQQPLSSLPRQYDASLNFAVWQDESALISRLKPNAMGHATAVHPLLSSVDEGGWVGGGIRAYRAWSAMRQQLSALAPSARYTWVVFRPSVQALDVLHRLGPGTHLRLPIGLSVPLASGHAAFAHVAEQRAGRAMLIPETC